MSGVRMLHLMHHTVPWGTMLCGATLRPPEVKSCRIIWCIIQRTWKPLWFTLFLSASKDFKICKKKLHRKSFWTFYCAFYKDILHFLNPNTALKNKITVKWWIFTWIPWADKLTNEEVLQRAGVERKLIGEIRTRQLRFLFRACD